MEVKIIMEIAERLKKLKKGTLVSIIAAMPIVCILAVTYYFQEHAKNEILTTTIDLSQQNAIRLDSLDSKMKRIIADIDNVYGYIDVNSKSNNRALIEQLGNKLLLILKSNNKELSEEIITQWKEEGRTMNMPEVLPDIPTVPLRNKQHREGSSDYKIKVKPKTQ